MIQVASVEGGKPLEWGISVHAHSPVYQVSSLRGGALLEARTGTGVGTWHGRGCMSIHA